MSEARWVSRGKDATQSLPPAWEVIPRECREPRTLGASAGFQRSQGAWPDGKLRGGFSDSGPSGKMHQMY